MNILVKSKCYGVVLISLIAAALLLASCGTDKPNDGGKTKPVPQTHSSDSNQPDQSSPFRPGEITHTDSATGVVTRKDCVEASDCGIDNAVCHEHKCYVEGDKCLNLTCGPLERCQQGTGALTDNVFCVPNCNESEQCGGLCRSPADAGKECVDFKWVDPCDGGVSHCNTPAGPICCAAGTGCVGNTCVPVSTHCDPDAEIYCKITEYCDTTLKKCVKYDNANGLCLFRPTNIKETKVALHWNKATVYTTPLVADLDGDNVPEIIFLRFDDHVQYDAQLVVIKSIPGSRETDVTEVWGPTKGLGDNGGFIYSDIVPAVADLNGDGTPEIVVLVNKILKSGEPTVQSAIKAFNADGTTFFQKDLPADTFHAEAGAISIADIDGDGIPEIITLAQVFNNKGDRIAKLPIDDSQLRSTRRWGPSSNAPRNLVSDVPVLADVNLDGHLDVIDGRMVFLYKSGSGSSIRFEQSVRSDGAKSTRPYDNHGAVSAIANFKPDTSTYPQIVTAHNDTLYLTDWQGNELASTKAPTVTLTQWHGEGAPTIADFDGDEVPEVGVTYNGGFAVYDVDYNATNDSFAINLKWYFKAANPTEEITGSSVFDFDGDGVAEVVYVDDSNIYILDGTKRIGYGVEPKYLRGGAVVTIPNANRAVWGASLEPVIADVDNDGHADIVASSVNGVRVFSNPKNYWVPTRPIWNQHAYFVTNIETDGRVPQHQKKNWTLPWLNNFRQNIQEGNPFLAADFIVKVKPPFENGCAVNASDVRLEYQIQNIGSAPARPNSVKVQVYEVRNGVETLLTEKMNQAEIPAQGTETFRDSVDLSGKLPLDLKFVVDSDNEYNECREDNNTTVVENVGAKAADATVSVTANNSVECATEHRLPIVVTLTNNGSLPISARSADVKLYGKIGRGGKKVLLTTFSVDSDIPAGGSLELTYTWDNLADKDRNRLIEIEAVVDEAGNLAECDESNNAATTTAVCQIYG